jgi:hypothetical protein
MSYYECDHDEHLAPLLLLGNVTHDSNTSDDSEFEVTSMFDREEHELVELSAYLQVHSDNEVDEDGNDEREEEKERGQSMHNLFSYSSSNDSADSFDLTHAHMFLHCHTLLHHCLIPCPGHRQASSREPPSSGHFREE